MYRKVIIPRVTDIVEFISIYWRMILRQMFKNWARRTIGDFIGVRIRVSARII
jgi:hypothetical protein